MTDRREASRPTRLLIIVTVFLVGAYPPVVWATCVALTYLPAVLLVPLAALAVMTMTLVGLWRPLSAGWLGAAATFLVGWMISLAMAGASLSAVDTAAVVYFTLALAATAAMNNRWTAWAEGVANRNMKG